MKAYGGVAIQIHIFSPLAGGEMSASRSGHFTPGGKNTGARGIECWWSQEPVWTIGEESFIKDPNEQKNVYFTTGRAMRA
jgi:hypothetical protein